MTQDRIEVDVVGHIVVRYGNIVESRPTRFTVRKDGDNALVEVFQNFDEKLDERVIAWATVREFVTTVFNPQSAKTGPRKVG